MKKLMLLGVSLLLTVSLFSGCGYNEIQTLDEKANSSWAQVENQLKRRNDLLPNLTKVAQAYAKHEKEVFSNIANARAKMGGAIDTKDPKQVAAADGEFRSALSRLMVVMENYPQLKADAQYTRLMDELAGTENRIAVARMDYNNTIEQYNTMLRTLPTNITAMVIQAKKREYYNPPEGKALEKAPELKLD